jgi:6-phosphogluconate dehydrogenase
MPPLALGLVGLRRPALYRRWLAAGVRVLGFDADRDRAATAEDAGVVLCASATAVAKALAAPRVVWIDVAPGRPTELALQDVWPELARGEVIVDGGDGHYRDAPRRAAALASAGLHFADCGAVDGVQAVGAIAVGATREAVALLAPALDALHAGGDAAWLHCGLPGAGHYVRMVRAGRDVAMDAAEAEARALLHGRRDLALDADAVEAFWRRHERGPAHASRALAHGTVNEALEQGVAAPVLSMALRPAADAGSAATADREDEPS